MPKKKGKSEYWDSPVYPPSKSNKRLVRNTPNTVSHLHNTSVKDVANTKKGADKDKYYTEYESVDRKHYANQDENEFSYRERARNRLEARTAGLEQVYPQACNLTKKDIIEEYPTATIICSSCNFMLEGSSPTIYVDSKQCQNNEYEVKYMQKYRNN